MSSPVGPWILIGLLCFTGTVFIHNGFVDQVSADNDHYDSIENAEKIGVGNYSGRVMDYYLGEYPNGTQVADDDLYSIVIPSGTTLNLMARRTDDAKDDVYCYGDIYDDEGGETFGIDLYSKEWFKESLGNQKVDKVICYLLFYGNGSYEFTTWFTKVPLKDMEQQQFNWVGKEPVLNASFSGSVSSVDIGTPSAEYYILTIKNGSAGKITLKKMGEDKNFMKLELYTRERIDGDDIEWRTPASDSVDVFLENEERSIIYDPYEDVYGDYPEADRGYDRMGDTDVYIRVWGTGKFVVTFEQMEVNRSSDESSEYDHDGDEETDEGIDFTPIIVISVFLISMLIMLMLPIIIVVIVIIISARRKRPDLPPSMERDHSHDKGDPG